VENGQGSVLYAEERLGIGGVPFTIYKFRTMVPHAALAYEACAAARGITGYGKVKGDPRVTQLGALLRRYWIDELPQLVNLLRGEMTLVGIRPKSFRNWSQYPVQHKDRALMFKPGLVGIGYASPGLSSLDDLVAAERDYLDRKERSPLLTDAKYLCKVAANILLRGVRSA
jgi:lipopolysaccharide/colanic/teichoic acid biosynthesis glycosyltransferase